VVPCSKGVHRSGKIRETDEREKEIVPLQSRFESSAELIFKIIRKATLSSSFISVVREVGQPLEGYRLPKKVKKVNFLLLRISKKYEEMTKKI
jgi:hypothetical protein